MYVYYCHFPAKSRAIYDYNKLRLCSKYRRLSYSMTVGKTIRLRKEKNKVWSNTHIFLRGAKYWMWCWHVQQWVTKYSIKLCRHIPFKYIMKYNNCIGLLLHNYSDQNCSLWWLEMFGTDWHSMCDYSYPRCCCDCVHSLHLCTG